MSRRRGKKQPPTDAQTPADRAQPPPPPRTGAAPGPGRESFAGLAEQAHWRLANLYEITKLFASFETVEQTFDPALGIANRSLPLRSAVLMEKDEARSRMIIWPSEGREAEQMKPVKAHVEAAYAYLLGAASAGSPSYTEQVGQSPLPRQPEPGRVQSQRFIVIPLVVAHRPPFGVLQLEAAHPLERVDLMFVNAIANQLAIALDRDRAWRRDISRREHAEEGRTEAEARGATSERGRLVAVGLKEKSEALAAENARLYAQAQQAVRAREEILAIVSHDLRGPLSTIVMAVGTLQKRWLREELPGALPPGIEMIRRAADRMLRLIGDLLDFASIEGGRLSIKRQPEDPGSILEETRASFAAGAQEKGVALTTELVSDLPKLDCDRDRILQVLGNLVGNALKVTPTGGRILLRAEPQDHEVVFTLSDTGPGIGADDLTHLFDRYWRSEVAAYKGTGLGLAIARGIVRAHGGRVWAESTLGQGATFRFTVPTAPADADTPGGPSAPSA